MADFPTCYYFVLANEDFTPPRYEPVSDPTANNSGAQALSGINSAAWPWQFKIIADAPLADRPKLVMDFYRENYWNDWYAQLASDDVAKRVLDMAVNTCERTAVKLLQMAVLSLWIGSDTQPEMGVDGIFGPETVAVTNSCIPAAVVTAFQQLRVAHYQKNDANSPYLAELIARAEK